ncbi:MAG: DUF4276 family protein [Magnetococcales bacterium]|nr:DUF4276 family protein [Magnetococcales bacterium]
MRIVLIIEGETERVFVPYLRHYLQDKLPGKMPEIVKQKYDGPIPTGAALQRIVLNWLDNRRRTPADHVIALTDVYTGSRPPKFQDAADAKAKMRQWVGDDPRFHPHAAQHDFEAWLLPYWQTIQKLASHNTAQPSGAPEQVNHDQPPAHRIKKIFNAGGRGAYVKPRDAGRILRDNDLSIAIAQCPELKSFVNTILAVCGGSII